MIALVAIVAVLLVIATAVQILKIAELRATENNTEIYHISEKQNKSQAFLLIVFLVWYFGFFAWQVWKWGGLMLPESASEHGVGIDNLMNITLWFITPVFIITHILLIGFSYKYAFSETRKAVFFSHSNKLELLWTIIPSIALTVLILVGLSNWNKIMTPVSSEQEHVLIEIYGQQFSWTARYAGKDEKLGRASVEYIEGLNALGIDTTDENALDDKIVKGEFHLPVNVPVQFVFRSQDVMHSAYMPHFRAQMNVVPGLKTNFNFIPTITTAQMKEKTQNENFNYLLLCNKICGAAHYNMQMDIIIDSKEDYEKWLSEQKEFAKN